MGGKGRGEKTRKFVFKGWEELGGVAGNWAEGQGECTSSLN